MSDYRQYLNTLRRVPDDIVLAVATRDIDPYNPETCICGWVLREHIARMIGSAADDVDSYGTEALAIIGQFNGGTTDRLSVVLGGREAEWGRIFDGIVRDTPNVERAFVERVLECVP